MCTACAAHALGTHRAPLHVQDQNFALFNFVNELNGECEKLEGQISELRAEIEKYKGQGLSTDSQRKKILKARGGWIGGKGGWRGGWMGGLCRWNSACIDLTPSIATSISISTFISISTSPPLNLSTSSLHLSMSPECISTGPREAAGAHRS